MDVQARHEDWLTRGCREYWRDGGWLVAVALLVVVPVYLLTGRRFLIAAAVGVLVVLGLSGWSWLRA